MQSSPDGTYWIPFSEALLSCQLSGGVLASLSDLQVSVSFLQRNEIKYCVIAR